MIESLGDPAVLAGDVVYAWVWREGKVLGLFRVYTRVISNKVWFPGGKPRLWETHAQALVRELYEEVRIGVNLNDVQLVHVCTLATRTPGRTRRDLYFTIRRFAHEPINAEPDEHGEIRWIDPSEPDLAPHNRFAFDAFTRGAGESFISLPWLTQHQYPIEEGGPA